MNLKTKNSLQNKWIVFSDIQGNFSALERLMQATKKMKKEGHICLGDMVQNGTKYAENRCIDTVREIAVHVIRGNHEEKALAHTEETKISQQNLEYLSQLPSVKQIGKALLFHSSTREKNLRLKTREDISQEAAHIKSAYPSVRIGVFGHTHEKGVYGVGDFTLINPGGIGVSHDVERSFALVNFTTRDVKFFTLEEAERLAYKADLVNEMELCYLPVLNEESYRWFWKYARNDAPYIEKLAQNDPAIKNFAHRLLSFDFLNAKKNKKRYIDTYSASLAETAHHLYKQVNKWFEVYHPLKEREKYLRLQVKKIGQFL